MKSFIIKTVFLFLIAFLARNNAQVDTLTILHLNDTHSTLSAVGPRDESLQGMQGGIARAATVVGLSKMTDPNVLFLHAGDYSIGDLFYNAYFGVPELQILKSLGLDAMTVGNHEWDLGPSAFLGALQTAFPNPADGFPLLSANTDLSNSSLAGLKNYIFPYTIKQVGNIKVGIFGMTTPETNLTSNPSPAVISDDIVNISANMVSTLKAQNCDVIILLSHLGLELDKIVAANVPGINVIVGGHNHYLLNEPVKITNPSGKTTWIVQAKSNYLYIGKLKLEINNGNVNLINYQVIHLDKTVPEDPTVLATVNSLISNIENIYGIPFYTKQAGYAESFFNEVADNLLSRGSHDTPIGNLVTDAFRWKTGTDIAIQAGGFTAMPLYQGPIVPADLFRVNGYGFNTNNTLGFQLATFEIAGSDLLAGLEFGLSNIELDDEYFMQVSGLEYTYDGNLPPFSRLTSVKIHGVPIDPNADYTVTTNEGILLFLDYLGIPVKNLEIKEGFTEFQALFEYVQNIGPEIYPKILGRVANVNSNAGKEFVNGGGWFEFSSGSLFSYPSAEGKMNFNFEVNPLKKENGNISLSVQKENFTFNASDIEWLAIDNDTAQFRGSGEVNGNKGYGFLIKVVEGGKSKDKIRAVIWDKMNGDALIFDNSLEQNIHGNISIHQIKLSKEISGNGTTTVPGEYGLIQNYPNPFNPTTTFSFVIGHQSLVTLKIYNILGEEVATLVNKELPAGDYKYQWNAGGFASGVYFYRMQAGNFVATKKLILMK
jgi:5'-nucleotidase / UDP-sugar diphosphatase